MLFDVLYLIARDPPGFGEFSGRRRRRRRRRRCCRVYKTTRTSVAVEIFLARRTFAKRNASRAKRARAKLIQFPPRLSRDRFERDISDPYIEIIGVFRKIANYFGKKMLTNVNFLETHLALIFAILRRISVSSNLTENFHVCAGNYMLP